MRLPDSTTNAFRVSCSVDVSGIVGAATFAASTIILAVAGCPAILDKDSIDSPEPTETNPETDESWHCRLSYVSCIPRPASCSWLNEAISSNLIKPPIFSLQAALCMYVCMHVCMCACMCVYVRMHACMHIDMYMYVYVHLYLCLFNLSNYI